MVSPPLASTFMPTVPVKGWTTGRAGLLTNQDGSYEMSVSPREAYVVYVDDKAWAASSRLDVIVHEGKPVVGVDFQLSRGTVIRGTVVVGPEQQASCQPVYSDRRNRRSSV